MSEIKRRTGKSQFKEYNSSATMTKGGVAQFDEDNEVIVGVTNKEVLGVNVKDVTSSEVALVDIIDAGSEWEFPIETGTMTAAEIGNEADLNSEDGLTLTESNGDVLITGWDGISTDKCYGVFKNAAFGSPGANVQTT